MFDRPLGKEVLPNVQSEPLLAAALNHSHTSITGYKGEEISTSLSISPQEAVERSPLCLLFSKLDKPKVSSSV